MQQKWLHSGLFPLCRDRRESAIAKKLQNDSVFCFWNELIAETEQIRKTEGQASNEGCPTMATPNATLPLFCLIAMPVT